MTEDSGLIVKNITVLPWKEKALLFKRKISDCCYHVFTTFCPETFKRVRVHNSGSFKVPSSETRCVQIGANAVDRG